MSNTTAFMAIPKPQATDAFADGDDIMRAIADRVDYLLGETIEGSITPSAANTKTTLDVNFGRTYKTYPRVTVTPGRGGGPTMNINPGAISLWVDNVTTTKVTIAINSTGTGTREWTIHVKPKRTDVTP